MINPIRVRPRVYREARALEEGSKGDEVKTKGQN